MLIHLDLIQVKFRDPGHKFTVTARKDFFFSSYGCTLWGRCTLWRHICGSLFSFFC